MKRLWSRFVAWLFPPLPPQRPMTFQNIWPDMYAAIEATRPEFNTSMLGWTDISRLAGGDYAVPEGDLWSFQPFGTNLLVANPPVAIRSIFSENAK